MKRILIITFLFLFVLSARSQIILTLDGSAYVNSDASWQGVDIDRDDPTILKFRNNSITSINTAGYMLQSGNDSYDARAHNLDNAIITGNRFDWNGTPGAQLCHGIMAGYSINYSIKYNYFDGPYYGIVHEGGYDDGESMVNTGGGITYNIFKDCPTSILTWGYENVNIYNNIFYYSLSTSTNGLITIGSSNGTDIPAHSKNVKIKNNIFYCTNDYRAIYIIDDASEEGFECDSNVYYWASTAGNLPRFRINATYYTWAEWQARGYDTHSIIVNPNFNNTTDLVPSARLDYGSNIGSPYDYGLSSTYEISVGNYPDTVQQDATWQVGAIVFEGADVGGSYYVAPWGDDNDDGSYEAPWATWSKAFTSTDVQPGDTVYFRGGVYSNTVGETGITITRDGTETDTLKYWAYPGEKPILDCSNVTSASTNLNRGINAGSVDYVHFKGLTLRNVWTFDETDEAVGWSISGSHTVIENCTVYNTHGRGFRTGSASNEIHFINCDSYNHCDSLNTDDLPGNDGYGWFIENTSNPTGSVYLKGCRAWNCGDDGFSCYNIGYIEFDNCWSFKNGQLQGGGHGFKLGFSPGTIVNAILRRLVKNCVATYNRHTGFNSNDNNDSPVNYMNLYNNIAYRNYDFSDDFASSARGFILYNTADSDAEELKRVLRNNISYGNTVNAGDENIDVNGSEYTHSNNTWDIPLTLTDADFVSLDTTGITAPRQADGSLPDNACYNNFLKLSDASQAINRGIDVGLPYSGDAPDLGPFEWDDYDAPPPLIATSYPTIITSKRIVAGGFIIEDYDESIVWKGVCWNTTGNPSDEDDRISGGTGSDPYTVTISGLTANTTYYIRAYAITESGTGYGNTYEITTDKRTQLTLNGKPVVRGGVIQYIE